MSGTLVSFLALLACPLAMAAMAGIPAVIHRRRRHRASRSATGCQAPALAAAAPPVAGRSHEAEAA
jgi:hypothetical protein